MDYTVVFERGWTSSTSTVLKELERKVRGLCREG